MCFVCFIQQKCLFCNRHLLQMVGNYFQTRISPNDPNGIYKLSSICATVGSVGMLVAPFLRELINSFIYRNYDFGGCTQQMITDLNHTCVEELFVARSTNIGWYEFSHLIIMLFGLITCIPFYAMEDLFSGHEGAKVMRTMLLAGTILEIMHSAFNVGTRVASGITGGVIFKPNRRAHPHVSMLFATSIFRNCFTWLTFFRDAILGLGVYIATVYDKELDVIGGSWRVVGYITAVIGVVNSVFEFLKLVNYSFFNDQSDFTYYVFLLCYAVWLFLFGWHCRNLASPEEKGMLDEDASSGAEVSDDDMDDVAPAASAPVVSDDEEEEEEEKAPKKKRRHHHKREASSDDDV